MADQKLGNLSYYTILKYNKISIFRKSLVMNFNKTHLYVCNLSKLNTKLLLNSAKPHFDIFCRVLVFGTRSTSCYLIFCCIFLVLSLF